MAAVARTPMGACAAVLLSSVIAVASWRRSCGATGRRRRHERFSRAPPGTPTGHRQLGRDIFYRVLSRPAVDGIAVLATLIGVTTGLVSHGASVLAAVGRPAGDRRGEPRGWRSRPAVALFFAVIFGWARKGAGAGHRVRAGAVVREATRRWPRRSPAGLRGRGPGGRAWAGCACWHGTSCPNRRAARVNANDRRRLRVAGLRRLSFLGIGVQAPSYDWGRLLAEGAEPHLHQPGRRARARGCRRHRGPGVQSVRRDRGAAVIGVRTRCRVARRAGDPLPRTDVADVSHDDALLVVDTCRSLSRAGRVTTPVRGVSFTLAPGDAVGVVGDPDGQEPDRAEPSPGWFETPGWCARPAEFVGTFAAGRGRARAARPARRRWRWCSRTR